MNIQGLSLLPEDQNSSEICRKNIHCIHSCKKSIHYSGHCYRILLRRDGTWVVGDGIPCVETSATPNTPVLASEYGIVIRYDGNRSTNTVKSILIPLNDLFLLNSFLI